MGQFEYVRLRCACTISTTISQFRWKANYLRFAWRDPIQRALPASIFPKDAQTTGFKGLPRVPKPRGFRQRALEFRDFGKVKVPHLHGRHNHVESFLAAGADGQAHGLHSIQQLN